MTSPIGSGHTHMARCASTCGRCPALAELPPSAEAAASVLRRLPAPNQTPAVASGMSASADNCIAGLKENWENAPMNDDTGLSSHVKRMRRCLHRFRRETGTLPSRSVRPCRRTRTGPPSWVPPGRYPDRDTCPTASDPRPRPDSNRPRLTFAETEAWLLKDNARDNPASCNIGTLPSSREGRPWLVQRRGARQYFDRKHIAPITVTSG